MSLEICEGPLQERRFCSNYRGEINLACRKSRINIQVGRREQPLITESFQADQKRIAGKSGEELIWRVAIAGRTQRQHLPKRLAGFSQPIGESVSGRAQITNSKAARKRGRVKQDAAETRKMHQTTVSIRPLHQKSQHFKKSNGLTS